jgi:hypothetical protein
MEEHEEVNAGGLSMETRKVPKSRPGRNFPRYKKEVLGKLPAIIVALAIGDHVSDIERDNHVSNATIYRVRRDLNAGVFDSMLKCDLPRPGGGV